MGLERRGRADQGHSGANPQGEEPGKRPEPKVKSSVISKRLIVEAWEKVRANNGAPGVDAIGIGLFAEQLRDNLDPHRFRRHHPKWHDGLRGENRKWDRLARSTPRNIRTRLWSW
jgi:hypothetical protein